MGELKISYSDKKVTPWGRDEIIKRFYRSFANIAISK